MKITKRKIVKAIYREKIKSYNDFLVGFIANHEFFPNGHDKKYFDPSYQSDTINYYAGNFEQAKQHVKLYNETVKELGKHDYIRYQIKEYDYRIHFLVDAKNNKYSDYDPYFNYPQTVKREIIPNKIELKKYIHRGCRAKHEYQLFLKRILHDIKHYYIPTLIAIAALIITYLAFIKD